MKSPQAPDPMQTAQAQSGMNRDTAIAQQNLNMVNQVTPWGSLTNQQTGTTSYTDSSGKLVTQPAWTQTVSLSPEQQAIFEKSQAAQENLAGIAQNQSGIVADTLSNPFEFNNQDAADWAYDLAQTRIAPQQQQSQAALRSQLINSGLRPGTRAWDSEMTRIGQQFNDQNNMLALQGRNQAFSEALSTRNQPLNELSALLSGSQVTNPTSTFAQSPQTQVAGVDYSGLVQSNYNQQMQQHNALIGGLFGLAGKAASFIPGYKG